MSDTVPLFDARDGEGTAPGLSERDEFASFSGPCALESDDFPFETISEVAERESWRKEINRPIYHIHKWWARRLGSVFRAIVLGALTPANTNILDIFYRPVRIPDAVVFDPFMGSGTTIGEAVKLGARAIGRDINPVAHFLVRNALARHDRAAVTETFRHIEQDVADEIRSHYKCCLSDGSTADVLYYFWVKQVDCPRCSESVDLFASRIFARHAYPRRHPECRAVCPDCGEINSVLFSDTTAVCTGCRLKFNPQTGPARGRHATCPACSHTFAIAAAIRGKDHPPAHRLYAKLVLMPDGRKTYVAATDDDLRAYEDARKALAKLSDAYPVVRIAPGYNTDQALNNNYRYWHQMFNARQLLCLSLLAARIRRIPDESLRELFTCLFSGVLEFNNLFASYKGEGTGAVRHMFAHHVLKPERTPLEANVWGTSRSSGSFMTLFAGRIRRALDYAADPFELRVHTAQGRGPSKKVRGLSDPIGFAIARDFASFRKGKRVYLSCGDSGTTDIVDRSVDAVITDPPFFDNVHYSQLADFFHVWQRHILCDGGTCREATTRSRQEVQNADAGLFTCRLASVWSECHRVLSDDGVLVFTYHHSRVDGWCSILQAVMQAGFGITAAHPVKSEMSVAVPKLRAKDPIDLDVILVCRKSSRLEPGPRTGDPWQSAQPQAKAQVCRLRRRERQLSRNDVRVIVMAQLIRQLSRTRTPEAAIAYLEELGDEIETVIDSLHRTAGV